MNNLCFADDVLLISKNREELAKIGRRTNEGEWTKEIKDERGKNAVHDKLGRRGDESKYFKTIEKITD